MLRFSLLCALVLHSASLPYLSDDVNLVQCYGLAMPDHFELVINFGLLMNVNERMCFNTIDTDKDERE
ncbi:MAG: hypothetical protein OXC30_05545 [Alphaproteobacteria bacterium]|nr:hypothetical protein [Alphaproteobacteria bacterium]